MICYLLTINEDMLNPVSSSSHFSLFKTPPGPSNGECVCGECQCKPGHTGKYCHICQECGPLDCSLYVDCVKCVHDGVSAGDRGGGGGLLLSISGRSNS